MTGDEAALVEIPPNENTPLSGTQTLSPSPHLYQKDGASVLPDNDTPYERLPSSMLSFTINSQFNKSSAGSTYFDTDNRKRRKTPSPPSESGTEADDEKGGTFLGLPAPPTRPRKGLKGANLSSTASPLLTPSYLDEEPRKYASRFQPTRCTNLQDQSRADQETKEIRDKFARRRRAELIRRVSETLLLGFVGFTACANNIVQLLHPCAEGSFPKECTANTNGLDPVPVLRALLSHLVVIIASYSSYPLRIILKNHAGSILKGRSPFYIHIPAAFEPAPLLYPIFIPLLVAISLMDADAAVVLPNLILSIASVPTKVIPFNTNIAWFNSLHWMLSTVPLLASRRWHWSGHHLRSQNTFDKTGSLNEEALLLLYPLHQALLPALQYLTTTSLLPAELQLLSVSMINLLLFPRSPQTVILWSLLWLGGLSVYVLCRHVLMWGVALARIPSWRFRRPKTRALEANALLLAIDDTLGGCLSEWGWISVGSEEFEDSEDSQPERLPSLSRRKRHGRVLDLDTCSTQLTVNDTFTKLPDNAATSATDDTKQARCIPPAADSALPKRELEAIYKRQRRYTVPSYVGSSPASSSKDSGKRIWTMKSRSFKMGSLRSLSKAQAVVLKWVFAIYVYAIVIAIVTFAVKPHVGRYALHDQDPVGWALGYLLGNIYLFKYLATSWNLDQWIHLPDGVPSQASSQVYSWQNALHGLGMANVRLTVCLYCLAIICIGLTIVFRLRTVAEVDTRRKVFHGMMVAMFLPTIFVDPTFVSLAFALILTIFLLLDLFRASQLPPLSKPLTHFLAPYVDGRDHRGPVIVSHIFLLIGCAIPLWLSLASIERTDDSPWKGWDVERREISMISGVVCVGMGDAAASLIGRRYGRRRWCWSGGKSLEGSLAFAIAVVLGLSLARLLLLIGGWQGDSGNRWIMTLAKASLAATGASLTEAVLTGGNDNVIVPVILWLLVRGLRI